MIPIILFFSLAFGFSLSVVSIVRFYEKPTHILELHVPQKDPPHDPR